MIDWLLNNMEWLFSGVGGVIGLALISRFFPANSERMRVPIVVREKQPTAHANNSERSLLPVAVERVAEITPSEIKESIRNASYLQRKSVASKYIGLRIEWETELASAEEKEKDALMSLLLRHKTTGDGQPMYVSCNVRLEDYKELAVAQRGAHIRVDGNIESADETFVKLTNAKLTLISIGNGS